MRNTFTPDSEAVYLAQGAVPPHDNVVTERISAPSRFWYSQGSRNARRRSPDCAGSWHEEGELLFSREENSRLSRRLPSDWVQPKWLGGCIFSLGWALRSALQNVDEPWRLSRDVPSRSSGWWYRQSHLWQPRMYSCSAAYNGKHAHGASAGSKQTAIFPGAGCCLCQHRRRENKEFSHGDDEVHLII